MATATLGVVADARANEPDFGCFSTIASVTLASEAGAAGGNAATGAGGGVAGATAAEIGDGATTLGGILRANGEGANEMTQNPRMKSPANIAVPINDRLRRCSRQSAFPSLLAATARVLARIAL